MTLYKRTPNANWTIELVLGKVGWLRRSTGVKNRRLAERYEDMTTDLYQTGQHDVLRGLLEKKYTFIQLYDAYKNHRLYTLELDTVLDLDLTAALDRYISWEDNGGRYRRSFKAFMGLHPDVTTVRALVDFPWDRFDWPHSRSDYRHLRSAVSKFMHQALEDYPKVWRRMRKRFPQKQVAGRVPDVTIPVFWKMVGSLPDHLQASIVCMALTGMIPKEYETCTASDLLPLTKQVHVPGTKTLVREDYLLLGAESWEWVCRAIPCPVSIDWLRRVWRKTQVQFGVNFQLRDLRHLFGQTATNEDVPEAKVSVSMRHSTPSMTRRYTRQVDKGEVGEAIEHAFFPHTRPHPNKSRDETGS